MKVSPAEPKVFKALGKFSSMPENFGVDFLWRTCEGKLCGIQRKAFPEDFVSSMNDGRLAKEIMQMKRLQDLGGFAGIIIEGQVLFNSMGKLSDRYHNFSKVRYDNFITSIQIAHGLSVWNTVSKADTISLLQLLEDWTGKDSHESLNVRPKGSGPWKSSFMLEQRSHFLQGLPGCGPKMAKAIVRRFNSVPLKWTCTEEELGDIEGIGPKRVRKWMDFLDELN